MPATPTAAAPSVVRVVPATPAPGATPPDPLSWVREGRLLALALAVLVAMGELSRLTGQVLDADGRTWAIGTLLGSGRLLDPVSPGWSVAFGDGGGARRGWVAAYLALDLVLVAVYGRLFLAARRRPLAGTLTRLRTWPPTLSDAVTVLAVVDLAEDAVALVAGVLWVPAPTAVALVVGALTATKLVVGAGVALLLVRRAFSPQGRGFLNRWRWAFYKQRFSVLVVLPLAVLGIPGGSDLLDQIPDVQRRWLADGRGALHAAVAVVVVLVVTLATFVLGRLRTGAMWRRSSLSVREEPLATLRLGLVAPLVVVLGLAVSVAHGGTARWDLPGLLPWRTLVFAGIPLVITLASWGIRRWLGADGRTGRGWFRPAHHHPASAAECNAMLRAGDLVAVAAVVVGGLGLVRSMTSVVALETADRLRFSLWGTVALVLGVVVTVGAWGTCRRLFERLCSRRPPPVDTTASGVQAWYGALSRPERFRVLVTPSLPNPQRMVVRVSVLVVGISLFFLLGYYPVWFGTWVGVIGTALLALLAAALVVGGSVVALQDHLAPELFWAKPIRISSVPVTTLLVGTIVLASGIGSSIDVHGVRAGLTSGAPVTRPTMQAAFSAWLQETEGCGHTVRTSAGRELRLRPMLLEAAEGGGIRAAYWTAASLDLARGLGRATGATTVDWTGGTENPCARALFGGGASGGAVGLTVARFAGSGSARDAVVAMAGPEALGAATSGLFVRDTAYAATGVPFFGAPQTALGTRTTSWPWNDRAGLIERSWERTSGLDRPYLTSDATAAAASSTGALVLTSTRVADGCRMWVSQLDLQATAGHDATCDDPAAPAGHTLDLFSVLAPGAAGGAQCLGNPTAATAAMLASRFPFVTPSGVVGPCGGQPEQQLVDGGYVENSGLGTVVDLAPSWLPLVQQHNAAALLGTGTADLVVPVVLYLDNGTGSDLVTDPPAPTSEVLVPSTTTGRAKAALVDSPALLRQAGIAVQTAQLLPSDVAAPTGFAAAVDDWRPSPVVVVHQSTFPAVTAPLGWVLSDESIETMDRALAQQARGSDMAGAVDAVSGNGSLADLLRLVRKDGS